MTLLKISIQTTQLNYYMTLHKPHYNGLGYMTPLTPSTPHHLLDNRMPRQSLIHFSECTVRKVGELQPIWTHYLFHSQDGKINEKGEGGREGVGGETEEMFGR